MWRSMQRRWYMELRQLQTIKSKAFYEEQAAKRNYFYYVDLQGQLFLEDMVPKNIATSLKSPKFLKFFFHMLRPHRSTDLQFVNEFLEYPYRSPCGPEMNYIKAADTPIVVTELHQLKTIKTNADVEYAFDPKKLAISTTTGRLYHYLETKYVSEYCLVRSHIAGEIAASIHFPTTEKEPHLYKCVNGEMIAIHEL
ncbi:hypothetical protein THRCLA_03593 [Thraustotheca clavata]|uniref:Uncharacterized protein n=1 Tax=Thraustotheca clavata TaxID=74557 RepID=A0A1W0A1I9_9STRA|nr:hypothetical protein THRCLA_03593 [Thraustotheca clavata]